MLQKVLRLPAVKGVTGHSTSTIYALMSEGKFPKPIPLGSKRAVGWLEEEITAWQKAQIAARDAKLAAGA